LGHRHHELCLRAFDAVARGGTIRGDGRGRGHRLIALAGSIFSTLATVFGTPVLQARREANAVLVRHREPLVAAA